jgi:hypothetical protein
LRWLAALGGVASPVNAARVDRAPLLSAAARPVLPRVDPSGAPGTMALDPTLDGCARQDALHAAIATHRGSCSWDIDNASCKWVVTLHSPEEHDFSGTTMGEALAWCLVWLMVPELGIGPFLV